MNELMYLKWTNVCKMNKCMYVNEWMSVKWINECQVNELMHNE